MPDPERTPDFKHQYAIEQRGVRYWLRVDLLEVGTDLRGAELQLALHRKGEPDVEYRLVRRPVSEWEPLDA